MSIRSNLGQWELDLESKRDSWWYQLNLVSSYADRQVDLLNSLVTWVTMFRISLFKLFELFSYDKTKTFFWLTPNTQDSHVLALAHLFWLIFSRSRYTTLYSPIFHAVLCPQAVLCVYTAIHCSTLFYSPICFYSPFEIPLENIFLKASTETAVWFSYLFPVFAVSEQLLCHTITNSLFPYLYYYYFLYY